MREVVQQRSCGAGLEPLKLEREPASSRSKPLCIPEKRPLPVRRPELDIVRRKQTVVRDISFYLRKSPVPSSDSPHEGSALPWLVDNRAAPPPSPNLVLTYPIERATVR